MTHQEIGLALAATAAALAALYWAVLAWKESR
jgi:hypothetical protein